MILSSGASGASDWPATDGWCLAPNRKRHGQTPWVFKTTSSSTQSPPSPLGLLGRGLTLLSRIMRRQSPGQRHLCVECQTPWEANLGLLVFSKACMIVDSILQPNALGRWWVMLDDSSPYSLSMCSLITGRNRLWGAIKAMTLYCVSFFPSSQVCQNAWYMLFMLQWSVILFGESGEECAAIPVAIKQKKCGKGADLTVCSPPQLVKEH